MKHLFLFILIMSFMSSFAFAAETTTDCSMMREQNDRSNPKSNLATAKPKPRQVRGASAQ